MPPNGTRRYSRRPTGAPQPEPVTRKGETVVAFNTTRRPTPAEIATAESAAARIIETLERVAIAYRAAAAAGKPQADVFACCRRAFEAQYSLPPERAAAWARLVVAFVGRQVGQVVYSPADFAEILNKALG